MRRAAGWRPQADGGLAATGRRCSAPLERLAAPYGTSTTNEAESSRSL